MGTSATTSNVYIHVIADVIEKVREEFLNNGGPGESVLNELQGLWQTKMLHTGVVSSSFERSFAMKPPPAAPVGPVHDLNVPYEGTDEYETPTAEILFPPTPLQTPAPTPVPTPIPTPLPGTADSSMYNIATGSSGYSTPANDSANNIDMKGGRSSQYMQSPSPWSTQRSVNLDVNVAYVEGREEADRGTSNQPHTQDFFMMSSGKRKRDDLPAQYRNGGYIPQRDGAGDVTFELSVEENSAISAGKFNTVATADRKILANLAKASQNIPQTDGPIPDSYDDMYSTPDIMNYQGVVHGDYNVASTPAPNDVQAQTPAAQIDVVDEDDDELLNEDDDDDYDDVDEGDDASSQHLVLAQFDKVTRTKSRWKCMLKDGIMHINNKDILFNKASGEFDF